MTQANPSGERRITGRTVLAVFVGFFGVIASVNAFMIWQATSTHTGIVVDSAWRSSGNWQAEIDAARAQRELGWAVDLDIARNGAGADVEALIVDAAGAPVHGIDVSVRMISPVGPDGDRAVTLREQDSGRYTGAFAELAAGRWQVLLDVRTGAGRAYRSQNALVVR